MRQPAAAAISVVVGSGYLLEEKLVQHPFLAEINPFTPNTVRMVTFADRSGEVHLDLAAVRLGRRGSNADNWAQGGIPVAVDSPTGPRRSMRGAADA